MNLSQEDYRSAVKRGVKFEFVCVKCSASHDEAASEELLPTRRSTDGVHVSPTDVVQSSGEDVINVSLALTDVDETFWL